MKKGISILVIILMTLIFIYYCAEIIYARSITKNKAEEFLSSAKINKNDLSRDQIDILIKIQDPGFYKHKGVDLITPGNGWTTITQSLAKKFYFKNFKQGFPKIKQSLCARFALHPLVSKDDQITIFLNINYFGKNQYGIVNAADYFYNKKVEQLTQDEYISLIACLISPVKLNIEDNPEKNAARVEKIKKYLSGEYKVKGLFDITYDKE